MDTDHSKLINSLNIWSGPIEVKVLGGGITNHNFIVTDQENRDLGQEVYIALTKADIGRGLVAGLCVAFIAIIADKIIVASSNRLKIKYGIM